MREGRSILEASSEKLPKQDIKLELDNPQTEAEIKVAIAKLQPTKA